MTAEIAVMNKNAIALAADSALTIGTDYRRKVLTSAEKIFAISKYEPVAAMVYGNATLMGVPWEAIIKLYRASLGKRRFPTIKEYAEDFLKFLHEHRKLFPEKVQEEHFIFRLRACFGYIAENIRREINKHGVLGIKDEEKARIIASAIQEEHKLWAEEKFLASAKESDVAPVRAKYESAAKEEINKVFTDFGLTGELKDLLLKIVPLAALKCPKHIEFGVVAGVVIAGFGDEAFFPALRSYLVNGIFAEHLNYLPDEDVEIGSDVDASIIPFAQDDQVYSFTHGVDRQYQGDMEDATQNVLRLLPKIVLDQASFLSDPDKKKINEMLEVSIGAGFKSLREEMKKIRMQQYFYPILDLVASLPKVELAAIAESMVNLTSLRRKMTRGAETVAGPIDVAIVSKGDGLVWIKRKHYFDAKLNHQFFSNYYRERSDTNAESE